MLYTKCDACDGNEDCWCEDGWLPEGITDKQVERIFKEQLINPAPKQSSFQRNSTSTIRHDAKFLIEILRQVRGEDFDGAEQWITDWLLELRTHPNYPVTSCRKDS